MFFHVQTFLAVLKQPLPAESDGRLVVFARDLEDARSTLEPILQREKLEAGSIHFLGFCQRPPEVRS